jgi:hypothetical protein
LRAASRIRVRDALRQRDLVGDLGLGVELVVLPDPPHALVGVGVPAEPEAVDDQALLLGVNDERHEVGREPTEPEAVHLDELRGGEGERLAPLVEVVELRAGR